jgi:hypothetical protein
MSPEECLQMSAERLLPFFVERAKRLGLGRGFRAACGGPPLDRPIALGSPEGERIKAELRAISIALNARPTTPEGAALLRDDDPDVRMTAALFLWQIDPELAEATRDGVMAGCSASEVVAARQRAHAAAAASDVARNGR